MSDSKGSGCAKTAGIGCLSIIGITTLMGMLATGNWIVALIIIGIIVVIAVSTARKKAKNGGAISAPMPGDIIYQGYDQTIPKAAPAEVSSYVVTSEAPASDKPSPVSTGRGRIHNPVCDHTFNRTEVISSNSVTCDCGNTFLSTDLIEYDNLLDLLISTNDKLAKVEARLKAGVDATPVSASGQTSFTVASAAAGVGYSQPAYQPAPREASRTPKPVKPTKPAAPKRPKVALSLQQWLIIGASLLVVVAGSVFVNSQMKVWNSQQFLIFTTIVAALAAFGAFRSRKISVLLASFLAAFSSAMQLASMSIIGDIFNPFTWSTMPAWYWAVSLLVVGVLAGALAKFSKNFGWKVISILAISGVGLIFDIGVGQWHIPGSQAPIHLAFASLTAVVVLLTNRFLRSIPHPAPQSAEFEEYEKNLAKVTDNGLFQFGRISAGLQLVVAIGLMLLNLGNIAMTPFTGRSTLLLTAVWIGLTFTAKHWSGQLNISGEPDARLAKSAPAAVTILLAISLVSAVVGLAKPLSVVLTLVGLAAILVATRFVKRFSLSQNQASALTWTGVALWALWSQAWVLIGVQPAVVAGLLIGLGLLLNLQDFLFKSGRHNWFGSLANGLAMVLYLIDLLFVRNVVAVGSASAGLVMLLLVVLANLQTPIRAFINKRTDVQPSAYNWWIPVGTAAALSLLSVATINWFAGASTLAPLGFVSLVYPVAALALSAWGPLTKHAKVLNAHAYIGHAVPVLVAAIQYGPGGNTQSAALLIAALAVINYAFGVVKSQQVRVQIGYGAALAAFWVLVVNHSTGSLVGVFALQLGVVLLASVAHSLMLNRRLGLTSMPQNRAPIAGILVGQVLLIGQQGYLVSQSTPAGLVTTFGFTIAATLAISAIARVLGGRLFDGAQWLLSAAGLSYGFDSLFLALNPTDINGVGELWRLLISLVVLSLVVRARKATFAGQLENLFFYALNLTAAVVAGLLTHHVFPTSNAPEQYSLWVAAALVVSTLLTGWELGGVRRLLLIDVPVLGITLVSLVAASFEPHTDASTVRGILSLAIITAHAYYRSGTQKPVGWLVLGYLASGLGTLWLADGGSRWLKFNYDGPEIVAVMIGLTVQLGNHFLRKRLGRELTDLRWTLLTLTVAGPSVVFAFLSGLAPQVNAWRELLALLVFAGLAYARTVKTGKAGWVAGAYAFSVLSALTIGVLATAYWFKGISGPEVWSVLVVGSILAAHSVGLNHLSIKSTFVVWDIPILLIALPSLFYGLTSYGLTSGQVREVASLAVILGLALLRTKQSGQVSWIIVSYLAALAEAAVLGTLVTTNLFKGFAGPEVFSLLAAIAVFGVHSIALKKLTLKSTMFSWGLPVAVLLLPSTLYTYQSLKLPFEQLDGLQVTRMIGALLASIVLLVLGIRKGNLANATMGLVGLALVTLPNLAMHTSAVTAGSQVESTSLVLGLLVFTGLWLFAKFANLKGNSRLFIGVPVVIALAPTLVRALMALANPKLETVDWWRFSIVLAASLTLLIIGSLRELAGMFYPGLISLLLSALPYGFKQSQSTGWLLWALLLLVAAVMVWLAVRLERMKKAGRSSAAWLKELK